MRIAARLSDATSRSDRRRRTQLQHVRFRPRQGF